MTGDEHYREAERLTGVFRETWAEALASVKSGELNASNAELTLGMQSALITEAQVHATLALAAATIDAGFRAAPVGVYDQVDREAAGYGA